MKGPSRKLGFSVVKKKNLDLQQTMQEIVKFSHILEKKIIENVMANKRIICFPNTQKLFNIRIKIQISKH